MAIRNRNRNNSSKNTIELGKISATNFEQPRISNRPITANSKMNGMRQSNKLQGWNQNRKQKISQNYQSGGNYQSNDGSLEPK